MSQDEWREKEGRDPGGSHHESSRYLRFSVLSARESSHQRRRWWRRKDGGGERHEGRQRWMSGGCKCPPLTLLSVFLSYPHAPAHTPLPPALLQIALHWWNFNGSFRKNNEHACPWSCVYLCVKGGFLYYTHLWRHATNVHMCKAAVCFSSSFLFFLYSHLYSHTHTPPQLCRFTHTLLPFLFAHNKHKYTNIYTCHAS